MNAESEENNATSSDSVEVKDPTARQQIRFRRRGALGEIILTRPQSLNSLSLDMIRQADPYLRAWAENPAVRAVAIHGDGDKAFCAGGDVRAVHDAGKAGEDLTRRFFAEEYTLNRLIHLFEKPYVALIDGVTMGGGVGLSVHGRYRVAGDRTLVAMPETGIGFFPDVGSTFVLSRMPGGLGMYIALTGARLGPADALYTGFATHYVPSDRILAIPDALVNLSDVPDTDASVAEILTERAGDAGEPPLAEHREAIDRCFQGDSVEAILSALDDEETDWAAATRKTLDGMSPTSLKLTFEALRRAAWQDFDTCLRMEFRISQRCMEGRDFYEGIRSLLVDKDKSPQWDPKTLAEVRDSDIEAYFESLGEDELSLG